MIVTMVSWGIMLFVFFVIGFALQHIFNGQAGNNRKSLVMIIWYGIVVVTVYAQTWSLFSGVSKAAFVVMMLFAMLLLIIFRKQCLEYFKRNLIELRGANFFILVVVFVVALLFTIQEPSHYDTYLYHAQNIRWIEKFGLVKGLGNLHNRFAYNSSFMCLQALFSFEWCLGMSLHTLNGFLWIFMMFYAVGTLKIFKGKKLFLSDLLKGLIFFYLSSKSIITQLSSPHTDMLTLVLVIYIFTHWVELLEEGEEDYFEYGMLCLLGVYATTAKLSAALILVLVLKPAIILVKNRKWKVIGLFIGSGILILLPFIVRNIMISGYLVYPYSNIDLFDVDWKMNSYQVEFDNHEIIAWGRSLRDVNRYEEPMRVWLPIWLEKQDWEEKVFMILNIILLPISLVVIGYDFIKRKYDTSLLLLCGSVLFVGWLLTAPLPRYGKIYLFLVPVGYLWLFLNRTPHLLIKTNRWKAIFGLFFMSICIFRMEKVANLVLKNNIVMPADYACDYVTEKVVWNEIEIYYPIEGDQGNYYDFPSIPYPSRLELIELRGDDMKEGFRIKEEYKNKRLSTYGDVFE